MRNRSARPPIVSAKNRAVGRSASMRPAVHVDDARRQALRLAEVVRAHDDRHAFGGEAGEQRLDLVLRRRVEAGGRLVEEEAPSGRTDQAAREREALLLAARERPGRPIAQRLQADARVALRRRARVALGGGSRASASHSAMRRFPQHRKTEQERPLEHHRLAAPQQLETRRVHRGGATQRRAGGAAKVVLPEPFAPTTATVLAVRESRGSHRAPRRRRRSARSRRATQGAAR